MVTLASSIIIGLVLTVCDDNTNQCDVYIPATYETEIVEQGKVLCRNEFKDLINDVMTEDDKVFVLDAECKVIQPNDVKG